MTAKILSLSIVVLLLVTPVSISGLQAQAPSFLNLVILGDSVAAGFQNGVLKSQGQSSSFATLVAQQMGTFLFLPLFPEPGVGTEITLVDGLPMVGAATGGANSRGFPLIVPQNLAIPGQTVFDALTVRPDLTSSDLALAFPNLILGVPMTAVFGFPPVSQIELAVALQPTFTIFWLGSNDVLGTVVRGTPATPLVQFQESYMTAVGALLTRTPTQLVVVNIPDVTVLPFLTSAEEIAAFAGVPLAFIGPPLGLSAGDMVRFTGVPLIEPILTGQLPGPLPPETIIPAAEVMALRLLTAQMNGYIAALGQALGFPVIDANGILNRYDQEGVEVAGRTLTTDFLGGIFDLGGIHPTNTTHALAANAVIAGVNEFYGTSVPPVDVAAIAANDPLFPLETEEVENRIMSMSSEEFLRLQQWFPKHVPSRVIPDPLDSTEDQP